MNRWERREKIADAMDAGVCFHCGKPILEGEAQYTLTHSHFACAEAAGETGDPFKKMEESSENIRRLMKRTSDLLDQLRKKR